MKKDTQNISGVRKSAATTASIGEPSRDTQQPPRRLDATGVASPQQQSLSSRYIDSRLKQFCLR